MTLDSQILSGIISGLFTILAAGVAIYLYVKGKGDEKRQAAKALYSEMLQFEKIAKDIGVLKSETSNPIIDSNKYFMPISRWNSHKYLFIENFDSEEWHRLETFFSQMSILKNTLDDIRDLNNKNVGSRMTVIHDKLGDLAINYVQELQKINNKSSNATQEEITKKYENLCNEVKNTYIDNPNFGYYYTPRVTYAFINSGIEQVDTDISISKIGEKLKALSLGQDNRFFGIRKFKRWF